MEKKILFSLFGGSELYGLNTNSSDRDRRGAFVGVEPNIYVRNDKVDSLYLRLDRALDSVCKSTQTFEFFYAPTYKFQFLDKDFYNLAMGPMTRHLIDTAHIYNSYEKYIIKHIEIGMGLRLTKKKDSKLNLTFEKYGYVPKGFIHAIRASIQVREWLRRDFQDFPSDFAYAEGGMAEILKDVKENPTKHAKEVLLRDASKYLSNMKDMRMAHNKDLIPNPEYIDFILKVMGQERIVDKELKGAALV